MYREPSERGFTLNIIHPVFTLLKGIIVGGTMLVPGVSGGSMAMILGIYDKLISSVSSFMKNKKENFIFLLTFSIGGAAGMLLFANPLLNLIEKYPMPMLYFFIGAVAGGFPLIFKQAEIRKFSLRIPLYMSLGLFIVLLISMLPNGTFQAITNENKVNSIFLVVAGLIAAAALVLPGISVSYLLLLMGLYDAAMRAIASLYLPFLIPLGTGLILGIILVTKLLEQAMTKHPQPTYLIIFGFVLGSIAQIFPGIPEGFECVLCIATLTAGFFIIRLLSGINGMTSLNHDLS